jgi:predicted nuclease with TOPRIM domain
LNNRIGRILIKKIVFRLHWTVGHLGRIKSVTALEHRTERIDLENVCRVRITSTVPTRNVHFRARCVA